jgi:hypothetical protein
VAQLAAVASHLATSSTPSQLPPSVAQAQQQLLAQLTFSRSPATSANPRGPDRACDPIVGHRRLAHLPGNLNARPSLASAPSHCHRRTLPPPKLLDVRTATCSMCAACFGPHIDGADTKTATSPSPWHLQIPSPPLLCFPIP